MPETMRDEPIERITTWKTADGRVHMSERSAEIHRAEGMLREFIRLNIEDVNLADWAVENSVALERLLKRLNWAVKLP